MVDSNDDSPEARRKRDWRRLKSVASRHGAIVLAAITLWGAADAWASDTGWLLAESVALLNALFAGTIIASILHEWGHFAGARLAGAVSPVLKEPVSFFMFNFRYDLNTNGQFLAMSMGGPFANWMLALVLFLLLPLSTWPQALLFATTIAIAVSVSVFEFPIIKRAMYGEDPREVVEQRQREAGDTPRLTGIVVGGIVWLAAV